MSRIAAVADALPRAAMELCWLYAWSAFICGFAQWGYVPSGALVVFLAAWALTAALHGRGMRLLFVLALHASALGMFALLAGHAALQGEPAAWTSSFARATPEPVAAEAWLRCALSVGFTGAFWWSGTQHARRPAEYVEICRRFDVGLLWLFLLLFVRLLMRDGLPTPDRGAVAETFVFPYLFTGLVAVARARNRDVSVAHKRFLSGHRAFAVASFALLLLVCTAAAALLALPLRVVSAGDARDLAAMADPLGRAFLMMLRLVLVFWLWLATLLDPVAPPPPTDHAHGKARTGPDDGGVVHVEPSSVQWMPVPLVAAALLLVVVYLYRRRAAAIARTAGFGVLDALRAWLASVRSWLDRWLAARRRREAARLYRALLRWGDRSGVTYRPSETPLEYGLRLAGAVSPARQPIDELVTAFTAYAYGRADPTPHDLRRARSALRRLRNPVLWPARARSWLRA